MLTIFNQICFPMKLRDGMGPRKVKDTAMIKFPKMMLRYPLNPLSVRNPINGVVIV